VEKEMIKQARICDKCGQAIFLTYYKVSGTSSESFGQTELCRQCVNTAVGKILGRSENFTLDYTSFEGKFNFTAVKAEDNE
jgi:ribosomal protein S27AE